MSQCHKASPLFYCMHLKFESTPGHSSLKWEKYKLLCIPWYQALHLPTLVRNKRNKHTLQVSGCGKQGSHESNPMLEFDSILLLKEQNPIWWNIERKDISHLAPAISSFCPGSNVNCEKSTASSALNTCNQGAISKTMKKK